MAEANCSQDHVCKRDFQVLLVGGFKVSEEEVHEAAWELCKRLFDFSERKRHAHYSTVKSVINSAKSLNEIPEKDVKLVLKFVFSGGYCADGIIRAIFAHSHGAKIVHSALQTKTMSEYFVGETGCLETEARAKIENIRKTLAVFTIGGIDIVPETMAKVVVNLRLAQDAKSFIGEKFFGEKSEDNKETKVLVFEKKPGKKTPENKPWLPNFSSAQSADSRENDSEEAGRVSATGKTMKEEKSRWTNLKSWMSPMWAVSTGGVNHVLDDYMFADELINYVISRLALDKEVSCGCLSRAGH